MSQGPHPAALTALLNRTVLEVSEPTGTALAFLAASHVPTELPRVPFLGASVPSPRGPRGPPSSASAICNDR